jgi:hypothetical protein
LSMSDDMDGIEPMAVETVHHRGGKQAAEPIMLTTPVLMKCTIANDISQRSGVWSCCFF